MKRIAIQVLVLLMAACSTPLPPAAPPPASTRVSAPQAAAPASLPPAKPAPVVQTESPILRFEHVRDTMANKSIYFDYDQYATKPDGTSLIMEQPKVAIAYPKDHITVQGN